MKIRVALLCCAALAIMNHTAHAEMIHAIAVHSQSGPISGNTSWTLGAPDKYYIEGDDSDFIQIGGLGGGAFVTLDFGEDSITGPGTLSIFTVDDVLNAFAKIELSNDGNTYSLLAASVDDTNGTVPLPETPNPNFPHATIDVFTAFRYVRITDLAGDDSFDLDAVGFEESQLSPVPEPTSMALLGLGTLGFAVSRRITGRRRAKDCCAG